MNRDTQVADILAWDLGRDAAYWGQSDRKAKRTAGLRDLTDAELSAEWAHYRRLYGPAQSERDGAQ